VFCVKLHILKLTQTAGQKLLFESKYTEAIPAAMQSLRVAVELYGLASVELVPAYLILGRASIGQLTLFQLLRLNILDFFITRNYGTVTNYILLPCSGAAKQVFLTFLPVFQQSL